MAMANHASMTVIGHATGAPMFRFTATGTEVGGLTIAVNLGRKEEETVLWQEVTVFGKRNEFLRDVVKGDLVFASGRVELDKWQDKNTGADRSKQVIIANDVYRLRSSGNAVQRRDEGQPDGHASQSYQQEQPPPQQAQGKPKVDDDIPF